MAFSGDYLCTSFKVQLLRAIHNFTAVTGNVFKLALYDNTVSLDQTTTAYSSTGEVPASGTYAAGGGALVSVTPTSSGTTALTDFNDLSFTGATITAFGALIYNSSAAGNPSVCVLDFGGAKSSSSGTFTIIFPPANVTSALIRIV
jgi:hypothetical protein